jgi:hypothetical protein
MLTASDHYEKYKEGIDKFQQVAEKDLKLLQQSTILSCRATFLIGGLDGCVEKFNGVQCHSALSSFPVDAICVIGKMLLPNDKGEDPYYSREDYKDVQQRFYDWLANRSPYKECFITKGDVTPRGIYIMNTSIPSNVLMSAIIASRQMWEHTWMMFMWHDLVIAGVYEHLAYLVATVARRDISNNEVVVPLFGVVSDWHTNFGTEITRNTSAKNFLENNWGTKVNEDYFSNHLYHRLNRVNSVFSSDDAVISINKILARHLNIDQKKVKNAFNKEYEINETLPFQEFVRRLVDTQDKIIQEILSC